MDLGKRESQFHSMSLLNCLAVLNPIYRLIEPFNTQLDMFSILL